MEEIMMDMLLRRASAVAVFVILLAVAAAADTLELRNGDIIQGKFLGGSPLNIRFEVKGREQVFATKDVLNISFSDTTVDAAAPAPDAAANPQPTNPDVQPSADTSANAADNAAPDATLSPSSSAPVSVMPVPAPVASQPQAAPAAGLTIPAGTSVFVRMIDSVDSSKNAVGDSFRASLQDQLVVNGIVVAPKDADVYGKLSEVRESGKISGAPQLTLELTGIRIGNTIMPIDSTDYNVAGKGRGKQSAERIGGGAVLGAIIGGIAGGGRGAAIGAGAGAGAGTAVQLVTHGDKIRIPSETVLEFRLQQAVPTTIQPAQN